MFEAMHNPDFLKYNKQKIDRNHDRCKLYEIITIIEKTLSKNNWIEKVRNMGEHIEFDNAPSVFKTLA